MMRSRPHLVFLPHWLLAAALLRLGRSPRRSWILLSTAGHFFATTGLHLQRVMRPRLHCPLAILLLLPIHGLCTPYFFRAY